MLRKKLQSIDPIVALTIALVAAAITALVLLLNAGPAAAQGGLTPNAGESGTADNGGEVERARLRPNGAAIPPESAPPRIKRIIRAANQIRNKPYKYGGGHGRWHDTGYDCSGAISFALRAGRMLSRPHNSTAFMRWGRRGRGKWITVFANRGHAYAMIAGLRWDTSGTGGSGPRWHRQRRSARGFVARRFQNF